MPSDLAATPSSATSKSVRSTAATRPIADAGTARIASALDGAAIQAAVHDLIAERATPADVAARLGVDTATVTAWHRAYTEAGLRAVLALIATAGEPGELER